MSLFVVAIFFFNVFLLNYCKALGTKILKEGSVIKKFRICNNGKIYDLYKSPSAVWKVKLVGTMARHDEGRAKNTYGIIHIQHEDGSSQRKM
jgi:hypothetical protein